MKVYKGTVVFAMLAYSSVALALSNGGGNEPPGKSEQQCVEFITSELDRLDITFANLSNEQYLEMAKRFVPALMTEEEFKSCIHRVRLAEVKSGK